MMLTDLESRLYDLATAIERRENDEDMAVVNAPITLRKLGDAARMLQEEFAALKTRERLLSALEEAGVNNWEGYSEAVQAVAFEDA